MNKFFTALLTVAALAIAVPVSAQDCEPSNADAEVDLGGLYVDNDPCQPECLFSIWVYQETNGIEGLQRGDEVEDNTCGGQIESDTIIL